MNTETAAAGAPQSAAAVRRRTLHLEGSGGPFDLAAIEFGDPRRPIDVVFLHANGFNAHTYRRVLEPLDDLRVLAVDQQGHGLSAQRVPSETRTDWSPFCDDLIALLDAIDGPPVILSGHSMGGAACLLATPERPGKVRALTLFDPVVVPKELIAAAQAGRDDSGGSPLAQGARRRRSRFASREEARTSYRGRGAFATWPDASLDDYLVDGLRPHPEGGLELSCAPSWEAANFASHASDIWAAMARVRAPVRILRAATGSTCRVTDRSPFPAENAFVSVETLPGTTHFLPLEAPEAVRAALRETAARWP